MRWSLDWPATLVESLKAAACLCIFIASSQAVRSKRGSTLIVKAVGYAGMAALLVALGHRIFGVSLIYGRFGEARHLLNGPFVNPNHNAEFLELSAFAALSLALGHGSRAQRLAWTAAAIACAAGAIATLSRGSLLALPAGAIGLAALLRWRKPRQDPPALPKSLPDGPRSRFPFRWVPWAIGGALSVAALALALGATAVIGRLSRQSLVAEMRPALWLDSLRVLAAHPLGIGGGAFDRVYPVYRTLITSHPTRFTHAENQPFQFLIEYGWPGFIVAVVASALTFSSLRPRHMPTSSLAILAALMAVVVHNLVDFGIELLGVSLPFFALLGSLAGRERRAGPPASSRVFALGASGLAIATTLLMVPVTYSRSLQNYDALIRQATTASVRQGLAEAAQGPHPTDYFYPLVESTGIPVSTGQAGWHERLRLLNHALRLCSVCSDVHLEVARTLWSLGRRRQAIGEYRSAITIQPDLILAISQEIWRNGKNTNDLVDLVAGSPERTVQICSDLLNNGISGAALRVLDGARAFGISDGQEAILRGRAALQRGQPGAAESWLLKAMALLPAEPGIHLYLAEAFESNGKVDEALRTLDAATARFPGDWQSAGARLEILRRHQRWSMTEHAIEAFKEALQSSQFPTTEAHLAAARIYLEQGRLTDALREYQLAAVQRRDDVGLLIEYARAADRAGRTTTATRLLGEASTLSPSNPDARVLLQQIAQRRRETSETNLLYNGTGSSN
jgi:tetratricopeptide (TPR) repeat protein